jgi:hypothetical protein
MRELSIFDNSQLDQVSVMSHTPALAASRTLIRLLRVLNFVLGAGIAALLLASFLFEDTLMVGVLGGPLSADNAPLLLGMRLVAGIGIAAVPLNHIFLTRLLAIVDTVRAGDAFILANAVRLQTIAWALLALEMLHLLVGAVIKGASSEERPLDIDWSFSFNPWLAVLLLFVLARVFEHGARMRADLEGTV